MMRDLCQFLCGVTLLTVVPTTWAATRTWTGTLTTDFELLANWGNVAVPANDLTTDIASFAAAPGVGGQPSLSQNRSINGLAFGGATAWTLGGTFTLTNGASGIVATGGTLVVNASLSLGAIQTWSNTVAMTVSGVIGGANALTKSGAGTLTLTGTNALTGGVTIGAGRLLLANHGLGLTNSTVTVNTAGGLAFSNATVFTLGALAGASDFGLTNTAGSAVTLAVGNNGADTSYAGSMSGGGGLIKSGAGTLILSGVTNNYTGATTVNGGILRVNGALSGGGRVMIASGGMLSASNSVMRIAGVVTNAGTLSVINGQAIYNGSVVNQGAYLSDPSTNTFNGNFTVGPTATVAAAAGDIYAFGSNFVMQSTNRNFNMSSAQVVFASSGYGITTGATNHTFDLSTSGAVDMGSNWLNVAQLATNFSIGTFSIATSNRLTLTGNKSGAVTNALYVGWLDIQGAVTNGGFTALTNSLFAALSLPDINLYYDPNVMGNAYLNDQTYNLWGGGLVIPIPEPSPILIVTSGLAMLPVIRRRVWRIGEETPAVPRKTQGPS